MFFALPASPERPAPAAPPPERLGRLRRVAAPVLWALLAAAIAFGLGVRWQIRASTRDGIYASAAAVPARPVAIVFGAGIRGGMEPSGILLDRLLTAVDLYKSGKVQKLLMTGDNSRIDYNEVAVMRRAAMRRGVPGRDIVTDHAGFRTYDSCYRARAIFGVRRAILVTQAYHLPRALYLARRMGIDAVGVEADRGGYCRRDSYLAREFAACIIAWVQVNVTRPRPHFLGPRIPIFGRRA